MGIPCRCSARQNGVKCCARTILPKEPRYYKQQPECPKCGSRSWYVDTYRIRVELPALLVCDCGAYRYPHRKFAGKCSKLRFAKGYWLTFFGTNSCESCNLLNADDPEEPPYCEVFVGQEHAKYCAAVQEFEVENNLKGV